MKANELKELLQEMNVTQLREVERICKRIIKEKSNNTALLKACTDVWHKYYKNLKGVEFVYDGAEMNALKMLISKCRQSMSMPKDETPSENDITIFFAMFLRSIDDEWILDHLSIKMINSKFNALIAHASKQVKETEQTNKHFERYD